MAWEHMDLGLSMFVGGAADLNENKNKMSIHENTQLSTKSSLQFPSLLQHMAGDFWLVCHNDLFDSHLEDTLSPLDRVTTFINCIPLSWKQSFNQYSLMSVFLCKSEMQPLVAVLPSPTDVAYQTFGAQIQMLSHGILQ